MSETNWFYARAGQQQGPTDLSSLYELIRRGEVQASDLVWNEGMPEWAPASQVQELSHAFAGAALAAPAAYPAVAAPPTPPPGMPYAPPSGSRQPLAYGGPAANVDYGNAGRSYASEAQTAMIVAIIGIFCFGIVLGPVGLGLGISARRKMRASGNMQGEGMAIAAIVIGSIIVGLMVLGVVAVVIAALLQS
jgi:hypothetical protein